MGNLPGSFIYRLKHHKFRKQSASKASQPTASASPIENTYLETFLLVWLDPHVDSTKENVRTQKRFREILTCLITFDKVKACEDWLKKCDSEEKIILIVSGAYGEQIVPRIHDTSSIVAIFVYCLDVNRNKTWAKDYSKIRSVQSSTDTLIQELMHHQTNLESVEDSNALQIYQSEEQTYTLDAKTASLIWYQLFLEILIFPGYLKSKETNQELIRILRQYSSGDEFGTNLIDEFERTYEPNRAVSWLIRDTPLVRFVNKALREQDINIIFPLRFFLINIHTQLIEHQVQSLNVFKLQLMSTSQMEDIKANPGQLMVVRGFLFASTNLPRLMSTVINNDQFETVLFDITAEFHSGVAPFALLRHIDPSFEEQIDREVLFMCGAIFQVGPLIYKNSVWKLQLRLVGVNEIPLLSNMKQKLKDTQNLNLIGDLLNQCGQGEKAPILFERLQDELSKTYPPGVQIVRQSSKTNPKLVLTPTDNVSFILLNLFEYMTDFASAVLKTLNSLAPKLIVNINEESIIDFSQCSKQPATIFTTAQCLLSSTENIPEHFKIFLLDTESTNVEQPRYTTIDALIGRLVDDVIENYRSKMDESTEDAVSPKEKGVNRQINRIYRELEQLHEKYITKQSSIQISNSLAPVLVWLISDNENKKQDASCLETNLGDYLLSSSIFLKEEDFLEYITEENTTDMFLIIDSHYSESIAREAHEFPHVKYVYYYGESNKDNVQKIIPNKKDLLYRLAYDLLDYYGKLGEQYRTNKQSKKARDMFSKARDLCQFLSTFFPCE